MRIIALALVLVTLAACQTTLDGPQVTRSSIASAMMTPEGMVEVITSGGESAEFRTSEVCGVQTWMRIGAERFTLRRPTATTVSVGGVSIDELRCPVRNDRPRNSTQRETPEETRERSGETRPGETRGQEGRTDDGRGADFGAISG